MPMRPEIFTSVGADPTTYQFVGHYSALTTDASRDLLARHQRISQQEDCTVADIEPIRSDDDAADMNNSDGKDGHDTANIALSTAESDETDTDLGAERTQEDPSSRMDCHMQGETLNGVAPHQDGPCITIEQPVQNLTEGGSQEFLMSEFANISGSPELDFLWSDSQFLHSFVSNDFFTTDLSIADISQKFTAPQDQIQTASPRPVATVSQETLPEHSRPQQPLVSRLPSLEPNSGDPGLSPGHSADSKTFDAKLWRLTSEAYQGITQECQKLGQALPPSFQLPSRHRMSRYLEGYFRGFHDHMPFLHTPTFKPETAELNLILAMAAVGALYKFEHARGYELYEACHHLVFWHLRRTRAMELAHLRSSSPTYASLRSSLTDTSNQSTPARPQPAALAGESSDAATPKLHLLQSLVIMLALTSWGDRSLVPSALSMSSEAATLAREIGISKAENNLSDSTTTWEQWVKREERRRTLFVTYILTNLQSIAFNVPPMILNNEVALLLPASAAEWRASNSAEWAAQSQNIGGTSRSMRQTLHLLLQGVPAHHQGSLSAFGNYVLIHNLLQQIFFARQASCFPIPGGNVLPTAFIKQMQSALRAWQEAWEATHESTLDPSSPKGPLGFNATALLRLAHIRLSVNIGPDLHLMTRDPKVIATSYVDINLDADQNARNMDWAVLQAIHALSIPVRVGVEYVARTQTLNWSVQHALCNLDCSLLLVHWLTAIANRVEANGLGSLRPDQAKLLNMTVSLVRETDMRSSSGTDQYCPVGIRHLAASVAKLWAETFNGFHVFEMVHVIGTGISMVAENLAAQARTHETQATAN